MVNSHKMVKSWPIKLIPKSFANSSFKWTNFQQFLKSVNGKRIYKNILINSFMKTMSSDENSNDKMKSLEVMTKSYVIELVATK